MNDLEISVDRAWIPPRLYAGPGLQANSIQAGKKVSACVDARRYFQT